MRWADLDMLGHVNNVTYVDYLQEARVDMLRTHGSHGHGRSDLAEGVVVVRHEVTYLRPLLFTFDAVVTAFRRAGSQTASASSSTSSASVSSSLVPELSAILRFTVNPLTGMVTVKLL